MRLLIKLLIILIPTLVFGQSIPSAFVAMGTIADLRLQPAQTNEKIEVLGLTAATDGQGGTYQWNPNSVAADDGVLTIQVIGVATGRWVRVVNTTYQPETLNYLARINAVGGKVSTATIGVIDRFISRGKSFGWYPAAKEIWIPVGDFAASQVKLLNSTAWTFNSFTTADYSEQTGDVVTNNSTKYIQTGFIPNSQGLTNQNISFAFASTVEVVPTNFGALVSSITDASFYLNAEANKVTLGNTNVLQNSFGTECTALVATNNASISSMYLNGTHQADVVNTTVNPLTSEINLFRGYNGGSVFFANGSIGFYWIGTTLTQAQALDLNQAIMVLMSDLRAIWKKACFISEGDSITAGTVSGGGTNGLTRYTKLFAARLGLREQNNAQGSSCLIDQVANTSGAVSLINRYTGLQWQNNQLITIMMGTNDIDADVTTNGNSTFITNFYNNYTTIVTALLSWGNKVILACPPYQSLASESLTKQLAWQLPVVNLAKAKQLPMADFLNLFLDTGTPDTYFADGKHPTVAGHALMANLLYAVYMGRPYRDALIPATLVGANGTATVTVTMWGAKNNTLFAVGVPTVATAGITYSVAWASNDTYTVTITNTTGSPITTTATNIRIQCFIDFLQ